MGDRRGRRLMMGIFMALALLLTGGCGDIVIAPDPCQCGICPDGTPPIQTQCPGSTPFCVDNFCSAQCPVACTVQICGADPACGDCGVCVDDGEICKSGTCECVPACDGLACGDDGCGGQCGECPDGTGCRDGICEDAVCTPGALLCDGQNLVSCDAAGLGPDPEADGSDCTPEHAGQGVCEETDEDGDGVPESAACVCAPACDGLVCGADGCGGECGTCEEGTACLEGACESQICTPGELFCANGTLSTCDEQGLAASDGTETTDCATEHGGQGACETTDADDDGVPETAACICVPACDGPTQGLACGADGCGGECGTCEAGTACAAGVCETQICTPAAPFCVDELLSACNTAGLGAIEGGETTDCSVEHEGQGACEGTDADEDGVPETAACVCVPACDGLVCGDDGCEGECGTCDAGTACLEGACDTQICTPGALFCAGDSLSTCDGLGLAAISESPTDCGAEHGGQGACEATVADEGGLPETASCVCVPACDGLVCGDDGCGGDCGTCEAGAACLEGACEAQICTPEALFCAGDTLSTCDDLGLAASDGAATTDCATEHDGQGACEATVADGGGLPETASCVCVPACDGLVCGDDGCGGDCGTCEVGTTCLEGDCLDEICEPFNSTCISTSVAAVCDSTGTGHVAGSESACSGTQVCDGESCNEVVCDPGAPYCEDESTASTCNGTGTGPAADASTQECSPGTICGDGSCLVVVCTPNEPYCDGPVAFICNELGTGPDLTSLPEDCQPGTMCVDGSCTTQTCGPGSTYCDENAVAICNETGTGPDPLVVLKNCNVTGDQFVCEESDFEPPFGVADWAECVCEPACVGKECGPDGCGEKCGNCPPGLSCTQGNQCVTCETDQDCGQGFLCLEQTCEEVICTPNESFCLSGSVLAVCNAVGTGPASNSEQSCTSQGNDFVCEEGACICNSPCDGVSCGGDDPCADHCVCGPGEFCDLAGPFPDPTPGWMSLALGKCIPCVQGDMWCSDDGLEVYLCDSLPMGNPTGGVVNVAGRVEICDLASPCQDNGDGTSSCGSAGCEPNCGPTNECGSDGCGGTCGECAFPNACGAITPDMCGCVLNSCEALGVSVCGSFDDGCGGQLQCACPAGEICTALQLCAPDQTNPGEAETVGCSDGTREGFIDEGEFPKIAACGGAWSVPGIHHGDGPSCGRISGDDSGNSDGLGCNVEDLCAEGWHVCYGDEDVSNHSPSGCDDIMVGAESPAFFLARATFTEGNPWICSGETEGTDAPANTDDFFGCGDMGCVTNEFNCKALQYGSHDGCMGLNYLGCECDDSSPATTSCEGASACTYCYGLDYWEWQVSQEEIGAQFDDVWECSSGSSEATTVVKSKSSQGGVLCCQDSEPNGGCIPQCGGKDCGSDGCGGTCGTCNLFETCTGVGICKCNPGLPQGSCEALP